MAANESEALRMSLTRVDDVSGASEPIKTEVSGRTEDVETASVALRHAIKELHEADDAAWKRYATDLDHATLRFDAALAMAAASLRAERSASKPDLHNALDSVARTWRGRADQLRLQTHLGEMDARDATEHVTDDLEAAGHQVTMVMDTLKTDAGQTIETLRSAAGRAIDGLSLALQDLRPKR